MTTAAIVTTNDIDPIPAEDCLFDAMIAAQDRIGQITWHEIRPTHAHGTYRTHAGTGRVAVVNLNAEHDAHTAANQWVNSTWTAADHDPTSTTTAQADQHTTKALAAARSDIHSAVAAHDDPYRRHQYARAALDNAATVLLAADATPDQREHAGYYLDDATAMLAT